MRHILVLESDSEIASRIARTISEDGDTDSLVVNSARAAYYEITKRYFDLAIIPVDDSESIARNLRALQPDLPIVVTTPEIDIHPFKDYSEGFAGAIRTPRLEVDLPVVFKRIWLLNDRPRIAKRSLMPGDEPISNEELSILWHEEIAADIALQVVLSRKGNVVAYAGSQDDALIKQVASQVGASWTGSLQSAQVKYLVPLGWQEPVVVYTCEAGGYLLSIVADNNADIGELRNQAKRFAVVFAQSRTYQDAPKGRSGAEVGKTGSIVGPITYALVFWPIEPLPATVRKVVRFGIRKLAMENVCELKHLSVEAGYIHLLASCPPGRSSGWVVQLFKEGTEKEIQAQFGFSPRLWADSYFATETRQPLSDAELALIQRRAS